MTNNLYDSSSLTPTPEREEAMTSTIEIPDPTNGRPGDCAPPPLRSILPTLREMEGYIEASHARNRIEERVALFGMTGVIIVLDGDLQNGWCHFVGRNGLVYTGPMSDMPTGQLNHIIVVARDLYESLFEIQREIS
ncbi:MAG: hypothetical protein J0H40_19365 [Rhizobiales bacterium]|nr:hypothetical protein [Hyphomicrobiales bacterium]